MHFIGDRMVGRGVRVLYTSELVTISPREGTPRAGQGGGSDHSWTTRQRREPERAPGVLEAALGQESGGKSQRPGSSSPKERLGGGGAGMGVESGVGRGADGGRKVRLGA